MTAMQEQGMYLLISTSTIILLTVIYDVWNNNETSLAFPEQFPRQNLCECE